MHFKANHTREMVNEIVDIHDVFYAVTVFYIQVDFALKIEKNISLGWICEKFFPSFYGMKNHQEMNSCTVSKALREIGFRSDYLKYNHRNV